MGIRGLACAGILLVGTGAAGCAGPDAAPGAAGSPSQAARAAGAVWSLQAPNQLGADTTTFAVLVRRVGCNNGVTGEVQEPDIQVEDTKITISFAVLPEQTTADCLGNDEVPYEVALPGPLGDRQLIDGQCAEGAEGSGTIFCRPDGVRYAPD